MMDKLIKTFSFITLVTLFVALFSGCEKVKESACTSTTTTIETTIIEAEETITMNADINVSNPYLILEEKTFNKLENFFKDNKDIFTHMADLMLSQENELSISYDVKNHTIKNIYNNDIGSFIAVEDFFSDTDRKYILGCFEAMSNIAPKDTRSLQINKTEKSDNALTVDFMFRSKLNIDYGFYFSETPLYIYDNSSKIDDNWYKFWVGLV